MSKPRLLLSGAILPLALIMGACSDKNKGDAVEFPSPEAANLSVESVDTHTIEKLLKVKKRDVKSAEADKALSKLGLKTQDSTVFSWDEKKGKAGTYTYDNLTGTGKDGEKIKIETLQLTGVHMVGDNPNFDRMDVRGLNVTDDDMTVSLDRLSLSRPSPEFGASILNAIETAGTAQALRTSKSLSDLDFNINLTNENVEFGALLVDDLNVTSEDGVATFGTLGWGENEATQKGLFLLEDFDFKGVEKPDQPQAHITLKSISANGIDMEHLRAREKAGKDAPLFTPYKTGYAAFTLDDFKMTADTLTLSVPEVSSQAEERGNETTIQHALKPVTLSFSERPTDPELADAWQFLQSAGYDALEFSAGSTTILNESKDTMEIKDSFLSLKDGFDLRFSLSGQGLEDVATKAQNQTKRSTPDDILDSLTLSALNLSLTDKSIVDRVFTVVAGRQGQKPGDLKKVAKGALMLAGFSVSMQAQTDAEGEILTDAIRALSEFVEDGGTLDVWLNPPEPLPAGYLSNIDPQTADVTKLGLKISHTQ